MALRYIHITQLLLWTCISGAATNAVGAGATVVDEHEDSEPQSSNLRQRLVQEQWTVSENIVGGTNALAAQYPFYGISKSGPLCG